MTTWEGLTLLLKTLNIVYTVSWTEENIKKLIIFRSLNLKLQIRKESDFNTDEQNTLSVLKMD